MTIVPIGRMRKACRRLTTELLAGLLMVGCLVGGETAVAAGTGHPHGDSADGHVEAMYHVKAQIPEEYRVMDRTPVTPTGQSLEKGQELYLKHCAVCHGQSGKGDGPAAAEMNPRPANFLDLEHSTLYGPGEKFWLIGSGAAETGMPGFAAQIPVIDRWHLVNYILYLQTNGKNPGGQPAPNSK